MNESKHTPDLLEACKALLKIIESLSSCCDCGIEPDDWDCELVAARAAIAKAEGETA